MWTADGTGDRVGSGFLMTAWMIADSLDGVSGWARCDFGGCEEMCPFCFFGDFKCIGNRDVFTNSSVDIDPKTSEASSSWLWGHNLRKRPSIR